jgi:hypothetical protein
MIKLRPLGICFVALLTVTALSTITVWSKQSTYRTYSNARFAYSLEYRGDLFTPQGESDNGDGQKFVSRDRLATILVYGSNNALNETLSGRLEQIAKDLESVTYRKEGKGWFVISGIKSGKVFYQKTVYKAGAFKTFEIEYPASAKPVYDQPTARMSESFRG